MGKSDDKTSILGTKESNWRSMGIKSIEGR